MEGKKVLIIDDEKNIRLTLSQVIESTGAKTETAVNGEEGLEKMANEKFDIILLDIKMPGIDGMEVLRRIREMKSEARVVMITAHGTIDNAVEAMKLGAIDFIQKPFSPNEIRDIVEKISQREVIEEKEADTYEELIQLGKKAITDRDFVKAIDLIGKAIGKDPTKAEPLNLLGILFEMQGDTSNARKHYLAATNLDPTDESARNNLQRITSWSPKGGINW